MWDQSFEESSESLDSELVSSSHELGDSSSSTASLALRFPRVSVRTQEFLSEGAFFEAQFNHTVFIYHSLKWDLLNFRGFVGEAENIIKDFLSDWA